MSRDFWRKCLYSCLRISPPTHKKGYRKFENPTKNFDHLVRPCTPYLGGGGSRGSTIFVIGILIFMWIRSTWKISEPVWEKSVGGFSKSNDGEEEGEKTALTVDTKRLHSGARPRILHMKGVGIFVRADCVHCPLAWLWKKCPLFLWLFFFFFLLRHILFQYFWGPWGLLIVQKILDRKNVL